MGRYVNKFIRIIVSVDILWKIIKPLVDFFKRLEFQRKVVEQKPEDMFIRQQVLKTPEVKNGIFKGLKYPQFEAAGSAIFPKFIGSYERELLPVFQQIIQKRFDTILDIGCAEGYYANGLALVLTEAKVYAYDVDERARNICKQIAELNQLENRVFIGNKMDAKGLAHFDFSGKKVLVISDCEGYEKQLFTKENIQNLSACTVLIEVHDLFDLTISDYLKEVFSATHYIEVICTVDDVKKAQTYHFPETEKLNMNLRKRIFAEGRMAAMEWYYCTPKIEV